MTLFGRPNVGKSTLFNRILGGRPAIVHARPGSTRDGRLEEATWNGASFELQDTGGAGAPDAGPFAREIRELAERAASRGDLILFLVDARAGLTHADALLAAELRRGDLPPVLLVANKAEGRHEAAAAEFHELGLGDPIPISAEHGPGVADLLDRVVATIPAEPEAPAPAPALRVAIVGRPNVGKSTLLNRLVGRDRALVSETAGTTRDPVDELLTVEGRDVLLVDTAGVRRGVRDLEAADRIAAMLAERALDRARIAFLMTDAREGPTALDAGIARLAVRAGCGVVVLLNRWDEVGDRAERWRSLRERVGERLRHLPDPPVLRISALTGLGVGAIWKAAFALGERLATRIPTPELNRFLAETAGRNAPRSRRGREVRVLYGYQSGVFPPRFRVFLNRPPDDLVSTWPAFLVGRIRARWGFAGAPIKLDLEERRGRERRIRIHREPA